MRDDEKPQKTSDLSDDICSYTGSSLSKLNPVPLFTVRVQSLLWENQYVSTGYKLVLTPVNNVTRRCQYHIFCLFPTVKIHISKRNVTENF